MDEAKSTEVKAEIHTAVSTLKLTAEKFHPLPDLEAEQVYRSCLREFVTASFEPRWWWEHLREPHAHAYPNKEVNGFDLIPELVPSADALCYFIPEDDEASFYPVFVTTPRVAASVLAECFAFEYYLTPLDFSWLIGENHHGRLFGFGEPVVSLLHAYANTPSSS